MGLYFIEIVEQSIFGNFMSLTLNHNHTQYRFLGIYSKPRPQYKVHVAKQLQITYQSYCEAYTLKKQIRELWKLIKLCFNNPAIHLNLAKLLELPMEAGPISLNGLPGPLLAHNQSVGHGQDQTTQLQFLFDFLRNSGDLYCCWIIYYSQQLHVLTVKLIREDELQENEDLFNPNINLIGLFLRPTATATLQNSSSAKQGIFCQEKKSFSKANKKQTSDNSTGSSWKMANQAQEQNRAHRIVTSKFKLRSISPNQIGRRSYSRKERVDKSLEKGKTEKSSSVLSRQVKSKSNLQLLRSQSIKQKLALTCLLNKKSSNEQKTQPLRKKLKRQCKLQKIQQIYQRGV